MNYTPGPWHIVRRNRVNRRGAETFDIMAGHGQQPESWDMVADRVDGIPNATLIAVAPELLEALQMQVRWIMRDGSPCACPAGANEPEGRLMPTEHSTACEALRLALAKAERRIEP